MAITRARAKSTTAATTKTARAKTPAKSHAAAAAAAPPHQKSTYANGKTKTPVAGVAGNVAAAPPPPLTGTPSGKGTIYDAQAYLFDRHKLQPGGELRLFHHATKMWPDAKPGEDAWISTKFSGGNYGKGFYSSTKPQPEYGTFEFQVAIPVKEFEGKKVWELPVGYYGNELQMPEGVDIVAVKQAGETWFVFKPGSDQWLNKAATTRDWDKPGEVVGWS
jgi:hypothetical protein